MKSITREKLIAAAALAGVGLAGCETQPSQAQLMYHYPPPATTVYQTPTTEQNIPQPTYSLATAPATNPSGLAPYQIDQLTGPVALYPDPLLAIVLPASTYPNDVTAAAEWLKTHPNPTDEMIAAQPWDQSVKALLHYPNVLQQLASNMDWTQALGVAFLNQQQDVMDSVQRLRLRAQAQGNLNSNPDQSVYADQGAIVIVPASPDYIYVPVYNPYLVYSYPCYYGFWGFSFGFFFNSFCCDWHNHCVNNNFHWNDHFHNGHFDGGAHVNNTFATSATNHAWTHDSSRGSPVMPQSFTPASARSSTPGNPLTSLRPNWSTHATTPTPTQTLNALQRGTTSSPQMFAPSSSVHGTAAPSSNFHWAPPSNFGSHGGSVFSAPGPSFSAPRSEAAPSFRGAPSFSAPSGGGMHFGGGGGGFSGGGTPSWGGSMGGGGGHSGGGGGGGGHR